MVFFHDLHHAHPETAYNELLFQLHAQADYFVSVLGGNALVSSYFAKINLIFAKHAFPSPANEMHHYGIPELNGSSYEYHVMYPKVSPNGAGKILHMKDMDMLLTSAKEHFIDGVSKSSDSGNVLQRFVNG